jgi:hypothetical protein
MFLKNLTTSTTLGEGYSAGVSPTGSTGQWSPSLYNQLFDKVGGFYVLPEPKQKGIRLFTHFSPQDTLGTYQQNYTYLSIRRFDLFSSVREILRTWENSEHITFAENIILLIQRELISTDFTGKLPPLKAFPTEEGDLLLEWIFKDFRLGFGLEHNFEESGWFLVSSQNSGGIVASGLLNGTDLTHLISWLVSFVHGKYKA